MEQTSVLIVDSEPVVCEGISSYLSSLPDVRVLGTTTSVTSVEDLASACEPEVIVIDTDFDGLSAQEGYELIARLRALNRQPAIVVLANESARRAAATALRYGASGLVLREAPLEDVASAIRWAKRGAMWVSPTLLTALFEAEQNVDDSIHVAELEALTGREKEILQLLVEGTELKTIAVRLKISLNTVRTHTRNIQIKLKVHSNVAAVAVALCAGMNPGRAVPTSLHDLEKRWKPSQNLAVAE